MSSHGTNGDLGVATRAITSLALLMTCEARLMAAEAKQSAEVARQMRKNLTPILEQMARDNLDFRKRYYQSMMNWVVDAALRITGADMGNLQLFYPSSNSLRIAAQRGFNDAFLEFFDCVHDGQAACGTAMKSRKRVIVDDVIGSPIFLGTTALEVMLDARARAVQSTPLVGPSGNVLGAISTHWTSPYRPSSRDLFLFDLLARTASDLLENWTPAIPLGQHCPRLTRDSQDDPVTLP